jgi:uncharacterized repeat protein (TIGR01451 family)
MRLSDHPKHRYLASLLGMCGCLLLIAPQLSWAAGTLSGTTISNSATVAFSISGVAQPNITSASVSFLVDEKINLTVAGGITTNVAPGSTAQATAFTVTNNSNSTLDFSLTVTSAIAGDNFDPTACSTFVESGATAGYQAGQDIATFIDELAADATNTVYVVCDIPNTAVNGNTALVGLTATALGNFTGANGAYVATPGAQGAAIVATAGANTQGTVDIVFGDAAGTEDAARDAKHSAHNTYSVSLPALSVTKTVTNVLDPNGGAVLMPGSVLTYQVAVVLTGAGTAANLVIADPLPVNTTYVPGSISITCISGTYSGGGACGTGTITPQPAASKTDTNADADFADFTTNTVTVSLGNVAAPANFVITFRATIN